MHRLSAAFRERAIGRLDAGERQDDVARVTLEFLQRQGITVHPHSALSPDLTPMEHLLGFYEATVGGETTAAKNSTRTAPSHPGRMTTSPHELGQ